MFECSNVEEIIQRFSLIEDCQQIKNGMIRIQTPFQYMDGSKVDLFIEEVPDLFSTIVISDMGETVSTLMDMHLKLWSTKKRRELVSEICHSLGVEREGGRFKIALRENSADQLSMAIVRLAQACIRIGDLALSQRYRTVGQFKDDLEEMLSLSDLEYETSTSIEGRYGRPVDVDFKVTGLKVVTLVQTLSSSNSAAAHSLSNEVFRKWYDLEPMRPQYQFLTIFDSSNDVFRSDDLARIENHSTILGFPAQQESIIQVLAA